ncbi:MAG TPA: hypothetical protein VJY35_10585 [Candidatus Eisenbacteria bacterium]|nr:hypothetical protein [Candidatus Eisenbacteria bacterium]
MSKPTAIPVAPSMLSTAPTNLARQSALAEQAAAYIVIAATLSSFGYPVLSEVEAREFIAELDALRTDERLTDDALAARLAYGVQSLFAKAGLRRRQ